MILRRDNNAAMFQLPIWYHAQKATGIFARKLRTTLRQTFLTGGREQLRRHLRNL